MSARDFIYIAIVLYGMYPRLVSVTLESRGYKMRLHRKNPMDDYREAATRWGMGTLDHKVKGKSLTRDLDGEIVGIAVVF